MADLHTRLHAEVERRLAIARAATNDTGRWRWDHGYGEMCNDPTCPFGSLFEEAEPDAPHDGTVLMQVHGYDVQVPWEGAAHIALHDPADAIRRYEGELKVLQRHAPVNRSSSVCDICSSDWHLAHQPCPEVLGVAERLGIEGDYVEKR